MPCSAVLKPGLGGLLGPTPTIAFAAAATAASAALVCPSLAFVVVRPAHAEASPVTTAHKPLFRPSEQSSELKSITSLLNVPSMLGVLARNVTISVLLRFNVYIVELLEHERKALDAEAEGRPAPPPPPLPNAWQPVVGGAWSAAREMAVRLVRRIYEHLVVWRVGSRKATPFLRDGVLWIGHVLAPMHTSSSTRRRLFSFTFALLHSNALLYAADFTVSVAQHVYVVVRHRKQCSKRQRALLITRGAAAHLLRCTTVLITTSSLAALASLAKPGVGTKVGWLLSDLAANHLVYTHIAALL
ncbi:hypothetical protein V8C86DRAFT_2471038 [Haematococcus lacustris]